MCRAIKDCGAALGGESSGHIVFSKLETTGDGLVTAIMLMETLCEGRKLSTLLKGYKPLPRESADIPAPDKKRGMRGIAELSKELERELKVRIIARASGTEEVIRITAEGEESACAAACEALKKKVEENLREV